MDTCLAAGEQTANGRLSTLEAHGYRARIATVGAAVVDLEYGGHPLVRAFDPQNARPVYSGAILAPWPNRVIDGRYAWDSADHQLGINEPERGHALHGLVFLSDFRVVRVSHDDLELSALIPKQEGYPFALELTVGYRLQGDGLRTRLRARNLGDGDAPYGFGSHCYLVAPGGSVDQWHLGLSADRVQQVDGARLIPKGVRAVDGTDLDFRVARRIGATRIDNAFTGLRPGATGDRSLTLTAANGVGTQISWDASCPWVQVYTADHDDPQLDRTALAVEPMSCPPGAFNDGTDVIRLPPGTSHCASWIIRAVGPR